MKVLISIFFCLSFLACSKKLESEEKLIELKVSSNSHGIAIPQGLWTEIDNMYKVDTPEVKVDKKDAHSGKNEEHGSDDKLVDKLSKAKTTTKVLIPPKTPMSLSIEMNEVQEHVLSGNKYKIYFGKGGGVFDLASVLKNSENGSFNLKIHLDMDLKDGNFKVFHLNNATPFSYSTGKAKRPCSNFSDITSFFHKELAANGVLLSTAEQRYISTLVGSFIFVLVKNKVMYIAQLSFKDSRFPLRHCRA